MKAASASGSGACRSCIIPVGAGLSAMKLKDAHSDFTESHSVCVKGLIFPYTASLLNIKERCPELPKVARQKS